MPTKKTSSSKTTNALESEASTSRSRFSFGSMKRFNIVYLLFFLLIISSFLIGVLFTQVQYLKNGNGSVAGINDTIIGDGNNAPQQPTGPVDVDEGHLPLLGNKDAKVTVVEFSDFQCPFCEQLFTESLGQIKKDYVDTGKIKFAYRHYPLTDLHPNAQKAAEASECANEQGNFWDYHDQLFQNQADWEGLDSAGALEKFVEYANTLGLNGESLRQCVTSGSMAANVKKDLDAGDKAGVDGTPATFINGMLISGAVPYEDIKAEIEKALAKK